MNIALLIAKAALDLVHLAATEDREPTEAEIAALLSRISAAESGWKDTLPK